MECLSSCAVCSLSSLGSLLILFGLTLFAEMIDLTTLILEVYPLDSMRVTFPFQALYLEVKAWAQDRVHWGVDLEALFIPCYAMKGGTVIRASRYDAVGWGKYVTIQHPGGYQTVYAHLSEVKVKEGQKVKAGQVLGTTGDTGSAEGDPHLHIELRVVGAPGAGPRGQLNPLLFFGARSPSTGVPGIVGVGGSGRVDHRGAWSLVEGREEVRLRAGPGTEFEEVGRIKSGEVWQGSAVISSSLWLEIPFPEQGDSPAKLLYAAIYHQGIEYLGEVKAQS